MHLYTGKLWEHHQTWGNGDDIWWLDRWSRWDLVKPVDFHITMTRAYQWPFGESTIFTKSHLLHLASHQMSPPLPPFSYLFTLFLCTSDEKEKACWNFTCVWLLIQLLDSLVRIAKTYCYHSRRSFFVWCIWMPRCAQLCNTVWPNVCSQRL